MPVDTYLTSRLYPQKKKFILHTVITKKKIQNLLYSKKTIRAFNEGFFSKRNWRCLVSDHFVVPIWAQQQSTVITQSTRALWARNLANAILAASPENSFNVIVLRWCSRQWIELCSSLYSPSLDYLKERRKITVRKKACATSEDKNKTEVAMNYQNM